MALQCSQDRISDELGRMAFPDLVVNITPPVIIGNCVIRGGVSKYWETEPFGLAISQVPLPAPVLILSEAVVCYAAVTLSYCGASRCLGVVGDDVIPLLFFRLALGIQCRIRLILSCRMECVMEFLLYSFRMTPRMSTWSHLGHLTMGVQTPWSILAGLYMLTVMALFSALAVVVSRICRCTVIKVPKPNRGGGRYSTTLIP